LHKAEHLPYTDARLKDGLFALLHVTVTAAKLCGRRRPRRDGEEFGAQAATDRLAPWASRAPNLRCSDRLL